MICRDHQHIFLFHMLKELTQLFIESRKCSRISLNISSVTVDHITVYQIHITKTVKIFFLDFQRPFHVLFISFIRMRLCHALTFEDVIDFSNSDHIFSFCF